MANAPIDKNHKPGLIGVSSIDGVTPTPVYVDPTTHRLYVTAITQIATGLITAGTNISITGNGTSVSPYVINASGGSGTVTSVATDSTLTGGPITTTGTLGLNLSNANTWSAPQTFASTNLIVGGAGTGTITLTYANTSASGGTWQLPSTSTNSTLVGIANGQALTNKSVNGVTLVTGGTSTLYLSQDGTYTAPAGGSTITIGTTPISGGTNFRVLMDNSGVVGEYATTGTGTVVMSTSPTLITPALGTPSAAVLTNATGLPAASVLSGTLGTGAYTMDTRLTVPQILNADNAITASANAATVTRANRNNVVTNNSAAGLTITLSTTGTAAGDMILIQSLPSSAVAQTITWVNTEVSDVTPSATLNASTTSPRTDGFKWNPLTSKWRCVASC